MLLFSPLLSIGGSRFFVPLQANDSIKKKAYKWYEVTETIKMPFGTSKVFYTVHDIKMINKNELGANNTRIVVEKWSDGRKKIIPNEIVDSYLVVKEPIISAPSKLVIAIPVADSLSEKANAYKEMTINPLETYERMAEKGIYSVEIYSQVADYYFYKNDYVKASKYYTVLFEKEKNIALDFYYRYAMALIKIGQESKADKVLKTYEALMKKGKK